MDAAKIAAVIVWLLLSLVFIMASFFYICYTHKQKRLTPVFVVVSIFLSSVITIAGSHALRPVDQAVDELVDTATEQLTVIIERIPIWSVTNSGAEEPPSDAPAEPESSSNSTGLASFIQMEQNRVLYHPALSVASRVLVPDGSLYPDIDMEAISFLTSAMDLAHGGYQGSERYSGAVTSSFTAAVSDKSGLFDELEREILKNPLVGYMIALGLQDAYPGFEQEARLKEFADACAAAYELPLDAEVRGAAVWLEAYRFPDGKEGIYVTDAYRAYAELLCQLLETFTNYGVHELEIDTYYSRARFAIGFENAQIERGETDIKFPALVLYRTENDGSICCAIGFDLNDKGLFVYDPSVIQE